VSIFHFSFFIVNGKWKMGVHFPFFIFHLEWKIKMTVCTRTFLTIKFSSLYKTLHKYTAFR